MSNEKPEYKELPHFDPNIKVRGVYLRKEDRRKLVYEREIDSGKKRMKAYARYLAEQHLGHYLPTETEVDHANRINDDDRHENLQLINVKDHWYADHPEIKTNDVICVYCNIIFSKTQKGNGYYVNNGKAGPFCSKKCQGHYGSSLYKGVIEKLPTQEKIINSLPSKEGLVKKLPFNKEFDKLLKEAFLAVTIEKSKIKIKKRRKIINGKKVYITEDKFVPREYDRLPYFDSAYYARPKNFDKKTGRWYVKIICIETKVKKNITYAKYLMEMHLNRELSKDETVDHIDHIKTNDVIENLQILSRSSHTSYDVKRVKKIIQKCIGGCGTEIHRYRYDILSAIKNNRAGPFCKPCLAKYQSDRVSGRCEKLPVQEMPPEPEYYYLDKSLPLEDQLKNIK